MARILGYPNVTPACAERLSDARTIVPAQTQYSNAPPLYYLAVGIPSLFLAGDAAVYAMRLVGDFVNAALIALGISLLLRFYPRRTVLVGVLIALSPMALYLMAVVNSSGLEIAAGFATWCGGVCVVAHPEVPRPLVIWTAVAAVLLALSRPTSPLDVVIIVIVLAFFLGWRRLREWLNPNLWALWIPVAGAIVIAAIFLLIGGPPSLLRVPAAYPASLLSNMGTTLGLTGSRLRQLVGDFGWLDTPVPLWVVVVWASCLGGLITGALFLSAACRRALPVLALLILAMPLALESPQINQTGPYWQGRYWLPVAIGFPLVAATFALRVRRDGHRYQHQSGPAGRQWEAPILALGLGLLLLAGQVASFEHALTRYEVGLGVPPGTRATWLPPGGSLPPELLFVLGALVMLALVVVMMARQSQCSPTHEVHQLGLGAREHGNSKAVTAS